MTNVNRRYLGAGLLMLIAVLVLSILFITSPRITPEANMRYAASPQEADDPDMAELLMLLNGE